ncbi:hypothetical protein SRHO_G00145890 [Serrasalmus rhombeus]
MREIDSEFADIPYHTEVRWLSREKVLNRLFELSNEICQFMDSKGKDSVLRDEKWKCELAFLADITAHLNALNLQLQGRDRMITDMYDAMKAFQVKLLLWEKQMHQSNLPHFPCCQIQVELIELQCNETLKAKYDPEGPTESIPAAMPQLRLHAARTLCMFGGTYLCEKLFSVMKTNKTAHRSRLTDERLQSILRVSTTRDLTPNINKLVAKKR